MGELNPFGIPGSVRKIMAEVSEKIKQDHWVEDSHSIAGHLKCACGTVSPYLMFELHQNNEVTRIIDLEISLTQGD